MHKLDAMALPQPSPTTTAVVVTGASSGIGADLAWELAARGHGVTLLARREDKLRDLADELKDVRVETTSCDVADPDARARLFDHIAERGLTVDVLVDNAGIGTIGAMVKSPVADEIAVQQMVPRGGGAILNVGSTAGVHPFPGSPVTPLPRRSCTPTPKGCARTLAGTGVTVATLCPEPGAHGVPEGRWNG